MKTRKFYLTISSLFLAACNSGSGDVGKNSNTDQNTLLFSSESIQMLTGNKRMTLEFLGNNKLNSNMVVNFETNSNSLLLESNSCVLSPDTRKCNVTIISGQNEGKYTVTAIAPNGQKSKSLNVTIHKMGTIIANNNLVTIKPAIPHTLDIFLDNIDNNYPAHKLVFKTFPELNIDKSTCIISGNEPHCKLTINSLNEGSYLINYEVINTFTNKQISGYSTSPIKVIVSSNSPTPTPTPTPDVAQIKITDTLQMLNHMLPDSEFTITASLAGNYQGISDQNIIAEISNPDLFIKDNNCILNQSHPSCVLQVKVADSASYSSKIETINLKNLSNKPLTMDNNKINFDISNKRVMFVTQQLWDGNLGGFSGANTKCQSDPNNPDPVNSKWKALLKGNNFVTPQVYIDNTDNPLMVIPNGDIFSVNALFRAIAPEIKTGVWTGGNISYPQNCNIWTSNDGANDASIGMPNTVDSAWIGASYTTSCNSKKHLYCVQQ